LLTFGSKVHSDDRMGVVVVVAVAAVVAGMVSCAGAMLRGPLPNAATHHLFASIGGDHRSGT
jgi:hypothetical protein